MRGRGSGLVLKGVEGREAVFERVGFFYLTRGPFFDGVERSEVVMI